ncbi:MAG: response regulator [Devosia sp.]
MPRIAEPARATILVVDDDALTLMTAIMTVEGAGYIVIAARDAEGAMQALQRHAQIAALFTDIHMPGMMDGLALAHETHRIWPAIRILLTSGDAHPMAADMPDRGQFLRKPYTPGQVVGSLSGLLV